MEWLAPIALALVVSVIAPYIASRQTAKLAQEKLDNEREYQAKQLAAQAEAARVLKETNDAAVKVAEDAARILKETSAAQARLLEANTHAIVTSATKDKAQLDRIEANGDGTLTQALRAQLAAEEAKLVVMGKQNGSEAANTARAATTATIQSLKETVRVRDETAAANAAKAAQTPVGPIEVTVVNTPDAPVPTVHGLPDAGDGAGVP